METFIIVIMWAVLSGITELSKRFNVSQTYILVWASLLVAWIYTWLNYYDSQVVSKWIEIWLSVLWTASAIYMFFKKFYKNK